GRDGGSGDEPGCGAERRKTGLRRSTPEHEVAGWTVTTLCRGSAAGRAPASCCMGAQPARRCYFELRLRATALGLLVEAVGVTGVRRCTCGSTEQAPEALRRLERSTALAAAE